MHPKNFNCSIKLVAAFCLLLPAWVLLLPQPTARAEEKVVADPKATLLSPHQTQYEKIVALTEAGKLPPEIGEKAKQYWLALRKYMIHSDAKLAMLRLEAEENEGERENDALKAIMGTSDERTRTLLQYRDIFDRLLAGQMEVGSNEPHSMPPVDEQGSAPAAPTAIPATGRTPAPSSSITITFEPENLADGNQFME